MLIGIIRIGMGQTMLKPLKIERRRRKSRRGVTFLACDALCQFCADSFERFRDRTAAANAFADADERFLAMKESELRNYVYMHS